MLMVAGIETSPRLAVTSRETLFSVADIATATPHTNYDVSPDGKTFAMVRFNPSSRIVVIQNLPELVRKLHAQGNVLLLKGVPLAPSTIKTELTTPRKPITGVLVFISRSLRSNCSRSLA